MTWTWTCYTRTEWTNTCSAPFAPESSSKDEWIEPNWKLTHVVQLNRWPVGETCSCSLLERLKTGSCESRGGGKRKSVLNWHAEKMTIWLYWIVVFSYYKNTFNQTISSTLTNNGYYFHIGHLLYPRMNCQKATNAMVWDKMCQRICVLTKEQTFVRTQIAYFLTLFYIASLS